MRCIWLAVFAVSGAGCFTRYGLLRAAYKAYNMYRRRAAKAYVDMTELSLRRARRALQRGARDVRPHIRYL